MPTEVDAGRAKLKGLTVQGEFDVEYKITFTHSLEMVRAGFPPIQRSSADVAYIRSVDGRQIPQGEYLLERPSEINRVSNVVGWHVLSWPRG